jgi:hypothetical protein
MSSSMSQPHHLLYRLWRHQSQTTDPSLTILTLSLSSSSTSTN